MKFVLSVSVCAILAGCGITEQLKDRVEACDPLPCGTNPPKQKSQPSEVSDAGQRAEDGGVRDSGSSEWGRCPGLDGWHVGDVFGQIESTIERPYPDLDFWYMGVLDFPYSTYPQLVCKPYFFLSKGAFLSWYVDTSGVRMIHEAEVLRIMHSNHTVNDLGSFPSDEGDITARPGYFMIQTVPTSGPWMETEDLTISDPPIYVTTAHRTLRQATTGEAAAIYGADWHSRVAQDMDIGSLNGFWHYTFGPALHCPIVGDGPDCSTVYAFATEEARANIMDELYINWNP